MSTASDAPPASAPRGLGQRIALGTAVLFYGCAGLSLAALLWWIRELGGDDPVIASLGACVVFFIGGGIVLHVIGRANLPELGFGHEKPGSASPRQRGPS
jgi:hypothetical protein